METFQDWMAEAIRRAGGQSALSRLLNKRFRKKITTQAIQYLANRNTKKPAQGSRLAPYIAEVTGLDATAWVEKNRTDGSNVLMRPLSTDGQSTSALELVREIDGMELTKDAIALVRAWMALPLNERNKFKRQIETASLPYQDTVPNERIPAAYANPEINKGDASEDSRTSAGRDTSTKAPRKSPRRRGAG